MIQGAAVLPPEVGMSSFAALLAPVLLVGASAVVMALVGLAVGIVAEVRDGACRRMMARAGAQAQGQSLPTLQSLGNLTRRESKFGRVNCAPRNPSSSPTMMAVGMQIGS